MFVVVYTCMEIPLTLAFNIELTLNDTAGCLSLSMDILLLTDIVVHFRTAYFDKWDRLNLVRDPRSIARKYICGWFFIDLFTSMPFELALPTTHETTGHIFDIFRMLRFVRIIKMVRLFKMMKIFDDVVSQIAAREFLLFLKFLKVFFLLLICTHLAACIWFFVGYTTMDSNTDSWISDKFGSKTTSNIDDIDVYTKYSYAWYWAVVTV